MSWINKINILNIFNNVDSLTIIDNSHDIIARYDRRLRFVYVNKAIAQLTALSPQSIIGKTCEDIGLPPEEAALWKQVLQTIAETQKPIDRELCLTAGNSQKYFRMRGIPEFYRDGTLHTILVMVHDITELHETKHTAQLREKEFQEILEIMCDGFFTWDSDHDRLYFSPHFYTMLGYEPYEFPASCQSFQDMLHPDERSRVIGIIDTFIKEKQDRYYNEFWLRTKTGGYRWIRAKARVLARDDDGGIVRIIGNHEDITIEKTTTILLEDTNKLLTSILDNTNLIIAYLDREFYFLRVNHAFTMLYGFTADHFLHKNYFDIFPDEKVKLQFENVVRTGQTHFEKNHPQTRSDATGQTVSYWDWSLVPIADTNGAVKNLVLTMVDVTRHINDENILRQTGERLEKLVAERTSELRHSNENLKIEILQSTILQMEKQTAYGELDLIFNSTTVGMALIDTGYSFIRVNKKFLELFCLKENDIKRNKCFEIFQFNHCQTDRCPMRRIISGETEIESEEKYHRGNGYELECQVMATPYYMATGQLRGILKNYVDRTEKNEIQRRLISVVDEERKKISHELHDELGQHLTAAAFLIESLRQQLQAQGDGFNEKINEIARILQQAQGQTRSISVKLGPAEIDNSSFKIALETLADFIKRVYNLPVLISFEYDLPIANNEAAGNLFYIIREAVNNAVKHGRPHCINVRITREQDRGVIIIHDDGSGAIDTARGGMGLKIMKYRAEMTGATLFAGNSIDGGFVVIIRL